jgi:membrane-associated phospholipid phosphatase
MLQNLQKKPYGFLYHPLPVLALFITTALLYFFCDQPITLWISQHHHISKYFKLLTHSSHGVEILFNVKTLILGIFLALMGMKLFNYKRFYYQIILMIFLLLIMDNILAYFIKHFMGKIRPEHFLQHHEFGFKFFQSVDKFLSFPSGHSIDIMIIAAVLMFVYPRFRNEIFAVAIFFCLSRVWFLKHFLSDVFFGGSLVFFALPMELYILEKLSQKSYFGFIKPALEVFKTKKTKGNKK